MSAADEQPKLRAQLLAEYGERIVNQAVELSGISMCLNALAAGELSSKEREQMLHQASLHLALLLDTVLDAGQSAKVTECAKRMDDAIDLWVADDIEATEGLPDLRH